MESRSSRPGTRRPVHVSLTLLGLLGLLALSLAPAEAAETGWGPTAESTGQYEGSK